MSTEPVAGELLPEPIADWRQTQPETGMGYQVVSLRLSDGRAFDRVAIMQGRLVAEVHGDAGLPFDARLVVQAIVTHDKWAFKRA